MRRHLSLVAATLLVFQVSVLAVSPFGVCSSVTAQAAVRSIIIGTHRRMTAVPAIPPVPLFAADAGRSIPRSSR
jgi:hypothetical protein